MRQAAVATQLRTQAMKPAIGVARIVRAGGLAIRLLHGPACYQAQYECNNVRARVAQPAHRRIQIQPHGAATTGVTSPIGTKYPLAYRLRRGMCLLLVHETMRNQLLRLLAMHALRMRQLHGFLLNGA